jgi:hypothetical protein
MPYVIAEPCIDVMDKACMDECLGRIGADTDLVARFPRD